jgi:hypothetical protein
VAPASAPRVEALRSQHQRAAFVCGKDALDRYFQTQVTQDARRRLATPFVMVMPDGTIAGYYTLPAPRSGCATCRRKWLGGYRTTRWYQRP